LFFATDATYLKPIDRAAVDKRWKLSQSVAESITNRREGDYYVKVISASVDEKGKHGKRAEVSIGASLLIHNRANGLKEININNYQKKLYICQN